MRESRKYGSVRGRSEMSVPTAMVLDLLRLLTAANGTTTRT